MVGLGQEERSPVQGLLQDLPPVSIAVVPWGTSFIAKRKHSSHLSQKVILMKVYFKVFTVNILIPFFFWHQTKNF